MTRSPSVAIRRALYAAALAGTASLCLAPGGHAQDRDLRPLYDRIDRLERDMNMVQRQVYRGNSNGAPVPVSPSDGASAVNTEARLQGLEDQMRSITGQLEETNYNIDQLKRRLDKLASDIDLRLNDLEHGGGGGGGASPGVAEAPPPPPGPRRQAIVLKPPPGAGVDMSQPPSQSGTLGGLPAAPPAAPAAATAPPPGGVLPSGSAQDQYNYAFGLLRQANYPAAEQALRAFVQRYPNDALAGNAQYWLGETYYVRNNFNDAAAAFAEGYTHYPKSGKAPDNLLKLGMALGRLGQKSDACRAFIRLDRDYPNAPANIKDRTALEKQQLGC